MPVWTLNCSDACAAVTVYMMIVDEFSWVLSECLASVIRAGEERSVKAAALSRKQA